MPSIPYPTASLRPQGGRGGKQGEWEGDPAGIGMVFPLVVRAALGDPQAKKEPP